MCLTCSKAAICALPRVSELPILECGTYRASTQIRAPASGSPKRQDRSKEEGEFRGLCADCELRNDCTFSRPESGVWHCEHYR